jgi:hypothetical protein
LLEQALGLDDGLPLTKLNLLGPDSLALSPVGPAFGLEEREVLVVGLLVEVQL